MNKYHQETTEKRSIFHWIKPILTAVIVTVTACGGNGGTNSDPDPNPDPNPDPPTGQSFNSGSISPGTSFSFTFDEEAMIDYICTIHPDMEGSVAVESGATNSGQDTVIIDNFTFTPADITIAPGTEITWVNEDDVTHTSTSQ